MLSPYPLTVGLMYAKRLKRRNALFAHQISSSDLFLVSMASHFLYIINFFTYVDGRCFCPSLTVCLSIN